MTRFIDHAFGIWSSNRIVPLLMTLALTSGMLACGQESTSPAPPPVAPPTAESAEPSAPVQPVTQKTRDTYRFYCTQCHGLKGKGDGINARFLTVPPRDHTKADYLETRSDEQLFNTIKLGGRAVGRAPCMPAWGHTFKDDVMHSLVRYIRELCQCEAL